MPRSRGWGQPLGEGSCTRNILLPVPPGAQLGQGVLESNALAAGASILPPYPPPALAGLPLLPLAGHTAHLAGLYKASVHLSLSDGDVR